MTQTRVCRRSRWKERESECMRLQASSFRSVAASPETVFGRRSRGSASGSRSRCTRCRAAPRSSTGPFPTNGTSATLTSTARTGAVSSTSTTRTSTSSATASRCGRAMTLDELRPHLHTHDVNPAWIPYRTSYYTRTWGFCLSRDRLDAARRWALRRGRRQHARGRAR